MGECSGRRQGWKGSASTYVRCGVQSKTRREVLETNIALINLVTAGSSRLLPEQEA